MKILMASLAIDGHFNPLTGVAMRLQADGHRVAWYTGLRYGPKLTELGIAHFPFRRAVEHTPENLNDLFPERVRLKGPRLVSFDGEKLFASNVGHFFSDIRDLRQQFPFDVLVADGAVYVQRLVTELLGVPVVSVIAVANMQRDPLVPPLFFGLRPAAGWPGRLRDRLFMLISDRMVTAPAQRLYNTILADYGVRAGTLEPFTDEPYLTSTAVIQTGTASFDFPRSRVNPRVHYVGPLLPYQRPEPRPLPFADKVGRYARTILLTQGTVDNKDPHKLIIPTIEALKDTDSLIVASTGNAGTEELRLRYPQANVVIEDYVDFGLALEQADVFVTNGGFGGVMLSLAKGVPLVCAGLSEGKNDVNAHVAYHQVGIDLRTEHPRPDVIRQAVDRVSQEPSWNTKAKEFQAEMMALDPAATVETLIEAMTPSR
jgi:UDP:flavonoid glycosyltransferase YjiC (YdhE family)